MVMMSPTFQDTTPCRQLKVSRRYGEDVASIFRVKEQDKQETSISQIPS